MKLSHKILILNFLLFTLSCGGGGGTTGGTAQSPTSTSAEKATQEVTTASAFLITHMGQDAGEYAVKLFDSEGNLLGEGTTKEGIITFETDLLKSEELPVRIEGESVSGGAPLSAAAVMIGGETASRDLTKSWAVAMYFTHFTMASLGSVFERKFIIDQLASDKIDAAYQEISNLDKGGSTNAILDIYRKLVEYHPSGE